MAEEEESVAKKAPVVKTTSSLAQSNVIKKKPIESKRSIEHFYIQVANNLF